MVGGSTKEPWGTLGRESKNKQICNHFGKNYDIIKKYKNKLNCTFEEAFNIQLKSARINSIKYNGTKMSLRDICKLENKSYIDVYNYLKNIYTLEYALSHTVNPYEEEK